VSATAKNVDSSVSNEVTGKNFSSPPANPFKMPASFSTAVCGQLQKRVDGNIFNEGAQGKCFFISPFKFL